MEKASVFTPFNDRFSIDSYDYHLLNALPAIIYINQIDIPGDMLTVRNVWMNQRAYELVKYQREEIDAMKYSFFPTLIHPDDLEVSPLSYQWAHTAHEELFFVGMHRVRPKDSSCYYWLYGQAMVLECYPDGAPKLSLNVAFEISQMMHTDNQFISVLKEIARQKNESRLKLFSSREKQILGLIAKGKTDKEIADELFISIRTAKKHRNNLIEKSGVNNTAKLVAFVTELGL